MFVWFCSRNDFFRYFSYINSSNFIRIRSKPGRRRRCTEDDKLKRKFPCNFNGLSRVYRRNTKRKLYSTRLSPENTRPRNVLSRFVPILPLGCKGNEFRNECIIATKRRIPSHSCVTCHHGDDLWDEADNLKGTRRKILFPLRNDYESM